MSRLDRCVLPDARSVSKGTQMECQDGCGRVWTANLVFWKPRRTLRTLLQTARA